LGVGEDPFVLLLVVLKIRSILVGRGETDEIVVDINEAQINLNVAQLGQFGGFLQQTSFSLVEGNLPKSMKKNHLTFLCLLSWIVSMFIFFLPIIIL